MSRSRIAHLAVDGGFAQPFIHSQGCISRSLAGFLHLGAVISWFGLGFLDFLDFLDFRTSCAHPHPQPGVHFLISSWLSWSLGSYFLFWLLFSWFYWFSWFSEGLSQPSIHSQVCNSWARPGFLHLGAIISWFGLGFLDFLDFLDFRTSWAYPSSTARGAFLDLGLDFLI